jgi:hypothetical protein
MKYARKKMERGLRKTLGESRACSRSGMRVKQKTDANESVVFEWLKKKQGQGVERGWKDDKAG